jgi:hypothetical protein
MGEITFTYPITPKSIGGFEIDAFISENYSFSNSVTDIPVEDGSNIADHVVEEPDEIQINGFIGNAEFTVWEGPFPESAADVAQVDRKERIRAAYLELLRLKRERQPVEVVTGLDTFQTMIITSFDIGRDAETGANLPFAMSFKKIKIIKSETTTINASGGSGGGAGDQTAGSSNMGVAATNRPDQQSNRMKEEWRQSVQMGLTTPAEYQQKWGVPYPQ